MVGLFVSRTPCWTAVSWNTVDGSIVTCVKLAAALCFPQAGGRGLLLLDCLCLDFSSPSALRRQRCGLHGSRKHRAACTAASVRSGAAAGGYSQPISPPFSRRRSWRLQASASLLRRRRRSRERAPRQAVEHDGGGLGAAPPLRRLRPRLPSHPGGLPRRGVGHLPLAKRGRGAAVHAAPARGSLVR